MKIKNKKMLLWLTAVVMTFVFVPTIAFAGDSQSYVAQNGTTGYEYHSLLEAVSDANSGDTITLLADDHESFEKNMGEIKYIYVNKTLTIDGNNYTVYGDSDFVEPQGEEPQGIRVSGNAVLTVKNIEFTNFSDKTKSSGDSVIRAFMNGGSVILDNVSFNKFNYCAVTVHNVPLKMNNCTINCDADGDINDGWFAQEGVSLANCGADISNTIINGLCSYAEEPAAGIYAECSDDSSATITVTDCSISYKNREGRSGNCGASSFALYNYDADLKVNINGGTYSSYDSPVIYNSGDGASVTVNAGEFSADNYGSVIYNMWSAEGKVQVKGGYFSLQPDRECIAEECDAVDNYDSNNNKYICKILPRDHIITGDHVSWADYDSAYTGLAKTLNMIIKVNGTTLKEGTDYKVVYNNNVNAGSAAFSVFGINSYGGKDDESFTITKAENTLKVSGKTKALKVKKLKKKNQTLTVKNVLNVSGGQGQITYKKTSGNKKITISKTGKVTVKKKLKKGTYKVKVKVTAAGDNNYNMAAKTATFKIKVK